jgi:hypothetical protein
MLSIVLIAAITRYPGKIVAAFGQRAALLAASMKDVAALKISEVVLA